MSNQAASTTRRLTRNERLEIRRRVARGESCEQIAEAISCTDRTVRRLLNSVGGMHVRERDRSSLRLSLAEREEISRGLKIGESLRSIASRLGRCGSTISREVSANGGPIEYRAAAADEAAYCRARRPKQAKLASCRRLRCEVEAMLKKRWSPQQIAARLTLEFPDDPEMRVSHETIYQSLFVQSRGALRKELTASLRSGRTRRRGRGSRRPGGTIKNIVLISERPAEVKDRAVPGHWEGDLIFGSLGKSAIATLVERQTRYLLLARIAGRTSAEVCAAVREQIQSLPEHLARSLTWDQGREMADHLNFTVDTGVQVYFCDPRSPWQRGTDENTNGLLRQYFPRGMDLSKLTQQELDDVAVELNDRPRETLGWMKPSEQLADLLR